MIYSTSRDALIDTMNNRCDEITDQNGKTLLNFMIQVTVIKIGIYPTKFERKTYNAETKATGFILIESIFN